MPSGRLGCRRRLHGRDGAGRLVVHRRQRRTLERCAELGVVIDGRVHPETCHGGVRVRPSPRELSAGSVDYLFRRGQDKAIEFDRLLYVCFRM